MKCGLNLSRVRRVGLSAAVVIQEQYGSAKIPGRRWFCTQAPTTRASFPTRAACPCSERPTASDSQYCPADPLQTTILPLKTRNAERGVQDAGAFSCAQGIREASWRAPVLWRFSCAVSTQRRQGRKERVKRPPSSRPSPPGEGESSAGLLECRKSAISGCASSNQKSATVFPLRGERVSRT